MDDEQSGTALTSLSDTPPLVEYLRGPKVESRHHGVVAITNAAGEPLAWAGETDYAIFPRSAIKPIQALPLLVSGAADAFGLDDRHIALAIASHSGSAEHRALVAGWLETIGLGPDALACGPQRPFADDGEASQLANNCSGKHAAMLTVCRHRGWAIDGYENPGHPIQQAILEHLETLSGTPRDWMILARDGCSIPAPCLALSAVTRAMAKLLPGADIPAPLAGAAQRIRTAWARHPGLVAGDGRFDTRIIEASDGTVLCKGGAEGVMIALSPAHDLAFALKIEDGASRAAQAAMAALLARTGVLSPEHIGRLGDVLDPTLRNHRGLVVGERRILDRWLMAIPQLAGGAAA